MPLKVWEVWKFWMFWVTGCKDRCFVHYVRLEIQLRTLETKKFIFHTVVCVCEILAIYLKCTRAKSRLPVTR